VIGANIEVQPHQLGHKIWPETYEVFPNEAALLLVERNETRPDFTGLHRYQTIFVARKDKLSKYMEDMGPAHLWVAAELQVPGGDPGKPLGEWWETVASLKDYADDFRLWLAEREYDHAVADLEAGYHDQIDEEARALRHLSQFGPLHQVTRG
jgi:hypothetical protein